MLWAGKMSGLCLSGSGCSGVYAQPWLFTDQLLAKGLACMEISKFAIAGLPVLPTLFLVHPCLLLGSHMGLAGCRVVLGSQGTGAQRY